MEGLRTLKKVVEFIRVEVSSDLQLHQLQLLLEVALEAPEPVTHYELEQKVSISQGAVSRNMKILGTKVARIRGVPTQVGYELVTSRPDLYETRKLAAELTKKGQRITHNINRLMTVRHTSGRGDSVSDEDHPRTMTPKAAK